MKIIVPFHIQEKLVEALQKAGNHEVGGIMMGEHYDIDEFHLTDITIQAENGTVVSFVRLMSQTLSSLKKFFRTTQKNYTRFNYIGEWHSHPSFKPFPSAKDVMSMTEIIEDKKVGANFVVLLVVKLNASNSLEGSTTVFSPNSHFFQCNLVFARS